MKMLQNDLTILSLPKMSHHDVAFFTIIYIHCILHMGYVIFMNINDTEEFVWSSLLRTIGITIVTIVLLCGSHTKTTT